MVMYVITHKRVAGSFWPAGYQRLLVGASQNITAIPQEERKNYLRDDTGENIATRNAQYSELTGLYWLWKNLPGTENVGITHYRRYFTVQPDSLKGKINEYINGLIHGPVRLASAEFMDNLLVDSDIVVTNNQVVPGGMTVAEEYAQAHNAQDLQVVHGIIQRRFPDYKKAFESVMAGTRYHHYNMLYTRRSLFNEYCEWLFNILFEAEQLIDISNYDTYQRRVFGFLSERLMDVWLRHNQVRVKELRVVKAENEMDLNIRLRVINRIKGLIHG